MPWPTWDQAAMAAVVCAVVWHGLRRLRPGRAAYAEAVAAELALICSLYGLWRLARMLPLATAHGAVERARDIVAVQDALHLPSELALQRF
ncbi:MAG: inositol phosphorylceramide synthase, partial [Actinobacteria bacterium]|nr:inositol phosphorylceramide synthase [Actinomycetota bacterium]